MPGTVGVRESQVVQLFHHTNTCGFLLLPLESRKCDTSGLPITPTPAAMEIGEDTTFNQSETRKIY
jgi:hypothetical protein